MRIRQTQSYNAIFCSNAATSPCERSADPPYLSAFLDASSEVHEDDDDCLRIFKITKEVKLLLEKEQPTADDAIDNDRKNSSQTGIVATGKSIRPLLPPDGKSGVYRSQRSKHCKE
jgi:hypothetical protein